MRAIRRARAPSAAVDQLPNRYASETKQLFAASRQRLFTRIGVPSLGALCIGFQFSIPFKENGREVQGLPGEFVQ
jgi:hypothetical protein